MLYIRCSNKNTKNISVFQQPASAPLPTPRVRGSYRRRRRHCSSCLSKNSSTGICPWTTDRVSGCGANRDRTGNLLVANQALSQLSYSPVVTSDRRLTNVGLSRVELLTSRLSGVRSNHLSYRPSSCFTNNKNYYLEPQLKHNK